MLKKNMLALVLVAHADDETLGVGGTIFKLIEKGWIVNVVALSDGRLTVRGKKQDNRKSFSNACKFLGVKKFSFSWLVSFYLSFHLLYLYFQLL